MGRVFTFQELAEKWVPRPESFAVVSDMVRRGLEACPGVFGAVACGSVHLGKHTLRSDYDCFVLYRPHLKAEAMATLQRVSRMAGDLHVPVNWMPLDTGIASLPVHHIGYYLVRHLERAAASGGVIKANPLPLVFVDEAYFAGDLRGYLRNKMRRIEECWSELDSLSEADCSWFLQKVLESPIHVARYMLHWTGEALADDSKNSVLNAYAGLGALGNVLRDHVRADSAYTDAVHRQLERPDPETYRAALEAVKDRIPIVLDFIRSNAIWFEGTAGARGAKNRVKPL